MSPAFRRADTASPPTAKRGTVAALLLLVLFGAVGCGSAEDTTTAPSTPAGIADHYALGVSGGTRTGCTSTDPEELKVGCAYSAAYAGCYKGITGRVVGGDLASQFPEPKLRRYVMRIYHAAVADCSYTP